MRAPKVLIINFHSYRNTGDLAILARTVAGIKARLPPAELTVVTDDPAVPLQLPAPLASVHFVPSLRWVVERGHGSANAGRVVTTTASLAICLWRSPSAVQRPFQRGDLAPLLHAFANADVILSSGGGYLYGSKRGMIVNWAMLSLLLSCAAGKPLWALPQSLGPFASSAQACIVGALLRRARRVYVRERQSLEVARALRVRNAELVPDLVIGLPSSGVRPQDMPATPHSKKKEEVWIGLTALDWAGHTQFFASQEEYERQLVAFVDAAVRKLHAEVFLFPQCWGPGPFEDDRRALQRIFQQVRQSQVYVCEPQLNPQVLQSLYGTMDLMVGTRLHSVLMALNERVPGIAIGYLPKSWGVLSMLGLERFHLPIEQLACSELVRMAEECLQNHGSLRESIHDRMVAASLAVERTLDQVCTEISGVL
jgi:colanic acid/amylovoran biosynthesis protein